MTDWAGEWRTVPWLLPEEPGLATSLHLPGPQGTSPPPFRPPPPHGPPRAPCCVNHCEERAVASQGEAHLQGSSRPGRLGIFCERKQVPGRKLFTGRRWRTADKQTPPLVTKGFQNKCWQQIKGDSTRFKRICEVTTKEVVPRLCTMALVSKRHRKAALCR